MLASLMFLAACGGGGGSSGSLGNAQPWCPIADDYIKAKEHLGKLISDDASVSAVADAREDRSEAYDAVDDVITDLQYNNHWNTSARALEDLLYEDYPSEEFNEAKQLVVRICA